MNVDWHSWKHLLTFALAHNNMALQDKLNAHHLQQCWQVRNTTGKHVLNSNATHEQTKPFNMHMKEFHLIRETIKTRKLKQSRELKLATLSTQKHNFCIHIHAHAAITSDTNTHTSTIRMHYRHDYNIRTHYAIQECSPCAADTNQHMFQNLLKAMIWHWHPNHEIATHVHMR